MRMKQLLRSCVMISLAGTVAVVAAQGVLRPCDSLPPGERESAQAIGACRERAPTVDVVPQGVQGTSPVPRVVGLSLDEARSRLGSFTVRRSYAASAEPGGTVIEQRPASPARLRAGALVHVVVSDGSLRPAPQVPAHQIDGVSKPAEAPPPPPVASSRGARQSAPPTVVRGQEVETRRAPARTAASKSMSTARSSAKRSDTRTDSTKAAESPPPSAVARSPERVTETLELPNVIGRSSADASAALAEFQVDRIEVVANAAPSGQVLGQDPAPGTQVPAGSPIGLQVSDGSLASVATATPQVAPTTAPSPAPARAESSAPARAPMTLPNIAVLLLIAGVLLGLGLGALLMRRWLAKRHLVDAGALVPTVASPPGDQVDTPEQTAIEKAAAPSAVTAPAMAAAPIRFAARLEEGKTRVEFAAPLEADEMTLEHSREFHE